MFTCLLVFVGLTFAAGFLAQNPQWNEELAFNNVAADATISLECWDQDLGVSDDEMGVWVSPPISQLCATQGAPVDVSATLLDVKHGVIHMTITWG